MCSLSIRSCCIGVTTVITSLGSLQLWYQRKVSAACLSLLPVDSAQSIPSWMIHSIVLEARSKTTAARQSGHYRLVDVVIILAFSVVVHHGAETYCTSLLGCHGDGRRRSSSSSSDQERQVLQYYSRILSVDFWRRSILIQLRGNECIFASYFENKWINVSIDFLFNFFTNVTIWKREKLKPHISELTYYPVPESNLIIAVAKSVRFGPQSTCKRVQKHDSLPAP